MKQVFLLILLCCISSSVLCYKLPVLKRELNPIELANLPAYGPSFGQYYLPVKIGTPPVKYNLCLQTGSSDLVLFDKTCTDCQPSPHRYNPKVSSSARPVNCTVSPPYYFFCDCGPKDSCLIQTSYAEEAANGTLYTDILYWAGDAVPVSVGSLYSAYPDFVPAGMDGMIGFNIQDISDWNGVSPFLTWTLNNHLPTTFAVCLLPEGAHLTIGEDLTRPSYSYDWIYLDQGIFVDIQNVTVNGVSIGHTASDYSQTTIDTGAVALSFYPPVFNKFAKVLYDMCATVKLVGVCDVPKGKGLLDGVCFSMTASDIAAFPSMTFYITGVKPLVLLPSYYMMPVGNTYCLGVQPVQPLYIPALGVPFIQGFNVGFDPYYEKVGFADISTCKV